MKDSEKRGSAIRLSAHILAGPFDSRSFLLSRLSSSSTVSGHGMKFPDVYMVKSIEPHGMRKGRGQKLIS